MRDGARIAVNVRVLGTIRQKNRPKHEGRFVRGGVCTRGLPGGGHFTSSQDMSVSFEDMSVTFEDMPVTFVGIRYVLVTIALQGKCTLAV